MFKRILNRWKMRTNCSCGCKAVQIDDYNFECPKDCGVYDGAAEFEQAKVLIANKNTIVRFV